MDTTKLKSFATRARKVLIEGVYKKMLSLGFNEDGESMDFPRQISGATLFRGEQLEESFYDRWIALHEALQSKGVREVCESVAYTWFNRLMAIRILYKNGFIAPVLTFDNPDIRVPHVVTEARSGRMPAMDNKDRMRLLAVINDASKTYEQFNILIVAVCHATPLINNCFGAINDYTELLLPRDILDENGFVDMLNKLTGIENLEFGVEKPQENDLSLNSKFQNPYSSPELLGWLYQFYISDRKDEVFAKKGKYNSEDIAPATQIFTPNWIVKYMVQNAVLPQIMSREELEESKDKYKYLVLPDDDYSQQDELRPYDEMRVGDLACGSGHILIECFNIMLEPLTQQLWSRTEAIKHMFGHTLIGVDIDTRAKQLATFALMLRACQEDSAFLDGKVMPMILDVPSKLDYDVDFLYDILTRFGGLWTDNKEKDKKALAKAIDAMHHVQDLGSIIKLDFSPELSRACGAVHREWLAHYHGDESMISAYHKEIAHYLDFLYVLSCKYDALIMNPPYMATNKIDTLKRYAEVNYREGKADLFSVFMLVCMNALREGGRMGMINMHNWMFIGSFGSLRDLVLDNYTFMSLLHLGARTFDELSGEVVKNVAFILKNNLPNNLTQGTYFRLVNGSDSHNKELLMLEALTGDTDAYILFNDIKQTKFNQIPSRRLGYWLSETTIQAFASPRLSTLSIPREGMTTAGNDTFLRLWFEVDINNIGFSQTRETAKESSFKWFPYAKGGAYRKWYGNQDYVVNWQNDGYDIQHNFDHITGRLRSHNYNLDYIFRPCLSWSRMNNSTRFYPEGFLCDSTGTPLYADSRIEDILAFVNSKISLQILDVFNPTVVIQPGDIAELPFAEFGNIKEIAIENISISKSDWDAHETSWDFQENPIIYWTKNVGPISFTVNGEPAGAEAIGLEQAVALYKAEWEEKFRKLHENEEELNRRFIEIYGLQDELSPEVPVKDITILQQGELDRDHFTQTKEYGIIDGVPTEITQTHFAWNDDVLMKQLISYAIGCFMGRYRLDKPGLAVAHPNPTEEELAPYKLPNTKYQTPNTQLFVIDDDAIIPIMPEECPFDDNASIRISDFIGQAFGTDNQIDSLNYMEGALGKSVSEYMQRDFWKDHKKVYQNRPIYWLFSSKGGAFKALVYMHRMDPFTVNKIRNNYLLRHIEFLKQKIEELKARQATLTRAERNKLAKMQADLVDCQEYEIRLHAVANQQIAIDLDNGVVANYALFGDVLAKIK